MKNLLKKQVLLALIFLGIATHSTSTILAMKPEEYVPFTTKDQKMIDRIACKFELGNPGDYKGYYWKAPTGTTNLKRILMNTQERNSLPKDELEFVLGH